MITSTRDGYLHEGRGVEYPFVTIIVEGVVPNVHGWEAWGRSVLRTRLHLIRDARALGKVGRYVGKNPCAVGSHRPRDCRSLRGILNPLV